MKKPNLNSYLFALSLAVMMCGMVNAQDVKSITDVQTLQESRKVYYLDSFTDGMVYFKDENKAPGKLNYNLLTQKMQFIQNDAILNLATPPSNVEFIQIGSDYFYPYQGRYLVAVARGKVSLLYSKIIITQEAKMGGYGTPNSTGSISNLNSLEVTGGTTANKFAIREIPQHIQVRIKENLYFLHNGRILNATKKNFSRCYPAQLKPDIETYYSTNKPNFSNLEDLKKITLYFNQK